MRLGIFLLLPIAASLGAQSLHVEAAPGANGREGALTIHLASPPGKEPVALQWDFSAPDTLLLDSAGARAGKSAGAAHKSIQCRMQVNLHGEKNRFWRCIVIGGVDAISNGPVAVVKYAAATETKPGSYDIQVTKAFAVSRDAKKTAVEDQVAHIHILN